jgi:hypothetical protein
MVIAAFFSLTVVVSLGWFRFGFARISFAPMAFCEHVTSVTG